MSKNELVERQKTKDKRRNPKVVKWEYVTEPFGVKVLPALFTRLHAPLVPWLSSLTENCCVHLRPCVQGVDEDGAVVKYLYCKRDGRFFTRDKDGWNEIIPSNHTHIRHNKAVGGSAGCPQLSHHGQKYAHRCVAVAWCNPPEEALAEINDRHTKKKWEVDHLNTDHKNWTADNLQWVTVEENRRRGKITRRIRKIGLDPKLLTRTLLLGIYTLPDERVGELLERFQTYCATDNSDLSIEHIRTNVAMALDSIKSTTTNNNQQLQ